MDDPAVQTPADARGTPVELILTKDAVNRLDWLTAYYQSLAKTKETTEEGRTKAASTYNRSVLTVAAIDLLWDQTIAAIAISRGMIPE